MIKVLRKLRIIIEYITVNMLFSFLSILPINLVSKLGAISLRFLGPLSRSNIIALSNYKKIFTNLSSQQIKKEINISWENLGKTIFELSILEKLISKKNNKIKIEGLENIKKLIEKKEQAIFFGIHQSNWEIIVPIIDQLGINITAIYRRINNKFIDKLVLKKRNQAIHLKESLYTPKGKESAKAIMKAINNQSSILVLIDQKDSAGDNVKLFNRETKTQTAFLKIARKHKLTLIPVKNIRNNINNFSIIFYPPVKPFEKNISNAEAMSTIHKIIEEWIKENPTQWFWQHNRFS